MAPSTLSYHLNKLIKNEIVSVHPEGYRVKNEEEISRILRQYKPSFDIEFLKDTWININLNGKDQKIY